MRRSEVLKDLLHLPRDRDLRDDEDEADFYLPLGYTVYRTCYTLGSDEKWQRMKQDITKTFRDAITRKDEDDESDEYVERLLSLVQLDFRSDPHLLNGLDMDQVRHIFMNSIGGEPLNKKQGWRRIFLLADGEVLTADDGYIKCIQGDFVAPDPVPPKNSRMPQRYFGWFKMTTRSLSELWESTSMFELSSIAPQTIGGAHLVVCKWLDGKGLEMSTDDCLVGDGMRT
jgi:hypothetical protein